MNKVKSSILVAMTLSLGTTLFGANLPSSSDILRQVEPPKFQKEETVLPQIKVPTYKAPMIANNSIKIGVKSFKITNSSKFSELELQALVKDYENKELTFAQLTEVTQIITTYYREKGYFVARAYLPAQELSKTDAIVEISIIEGYYGKFNVENDSLVNSETINGFMNNLQGGIISTKSLERQMLLVDDLGGVKIVNAEILSGQTTGTSDFTITTQSEPKYYGYVIADNYGSRYTGESRVNATGYVNSLTGRGDVLGLSTLDSTNKDLINGRVSYSLPIGYSGLSFNSSVAHTSYKIGKEFKNLDIKGNSTNFDMGLKYVFVKTREHTLDTSLTYTNANSLDKDNYQENRKKNINSLKLSLNDNLKTSMFNKVGNLESAMAIVVGNANLNSYAKSIDTLNSDGNYSKLTASISQNQLLTQNISLLASLSGQIALNRNLQGTEDFSAGGPNGVRAYTDSELSGDKGYLSTLELSYNLPTIMGIKHTLSTFVDHSKVWNNKEAVGSVIIESREINDIGLGYSLYKGDFSIKSTYAHGFGVDKTPTGDGDNRNLNRVFVQAIFRF